MTTTNVHDTYTPAQVDRSEESNVARRSTNYITDKYFDFQRRQGGTHQFDVLAKSSDLAWSVGQGLDLPNVSFQADEGFLKQRICLEVRSK